MNPNTDQRSMRVYASDNTQYRTEPNEEQTRNGVVPLDSLPAAWWNWLWYEIISNNNNALLSITDLRTEIGNVLTNAGITASAQVTNQLAQAIIIIHQRKPFFDDQHNPVPGSVISSAARSSVSVDGSTGQMTVNALSDWASQDSVKTVIDNLINGGSGSIASLEQDIADLNQKTGSLSSLSTTDKSNLVAAINEVDGHVDSNTTAISDETTARQNADSSLSQAISDEATARQNADSSLSQAISDETTARQNADSSLSQAISDEATARQNADGTLANLTTTTKTNLVAAINEVNDKANPVQYSTSEFDTKKKWTNGKQIYGRVLPVDFGFFLNYTMATTGSIGFYPQSVSGLFRGKTYLIGPQGRLYISTDGQNFTLSANIGDSNTNVVSSLIVFHDILIISPRGKGIYISADGQTFTHSTEVSSAEIMSFVIWNDVLYFGPTGGNYLYSSVDGQNFTRITTTPGVPTHVLEVFNNTLYRGTDGPGGIYASVDGINFSKKLSLAASCFVLKKIRGILYAGGSSSGLYMSVDGQTFTQIASIPPTSTISSVISFNDKVYVATYNFGFYSSTDGINFTQDTSIPEGSMPVKLLAVENNILYLVTQSAGCYQSSVYGIASAPTLSNISELLFTQLRGSAGPLGLKSAHIDSSNHLVVEGDGTPTQAIIEYTKTT